MSDRNFQEYEAKWQKSWEESGLYKADNPEDASTGKKFYGLIEFPYPSGAGLHVGHPRSYTAIDAICRKRRMEGRNVLYPIGWDAFGLPTENYAIKNKMKPQDATAENIANFTRQLKSIGCGFDWSREINTTDPAYYKWTQWQFLKFFESWYDKRERRARPIAELLIPADVTALGENAVRAYVNDHRMAFKSTSTINWCPSCKIGLANEEAVGGVCERCGSAVTKKEKEQWMIRITEYAERLLEDLETVDYLDKIKAQQVHWIGKSEGALVAFDCVAGEAEGVVKVFTTRPDTLFGATYLVFAPEHALVREWLGEGRVKNAGEVQEYIHATGVQTDIERTAEGREKTGIELQGVKAIHPITGEALPVWISDYVLASYGTGAIMAVPAHDERDFAFAKKFNLPIKYVVAPVLVDGGNPPLDGKKTVARQTVHVIIRNPKTREILCLKWKHRDWTTFVVGGIDEGEDVIDAARREALEETGYKDLRLIRVLGGPVRAEYFAAHKDENRIAYVTTVLFELESDAREEVHEEEFEKHDPVWIAEADLAKQGMPPLELEYWLPRLANEMNNVFTGEGEAIHSDFLNELPTWKAKDDMISWLEENQKGERAVNYKLRDWVFSRQRYWGEPIPIIHCEQCGEIPVPESQLPVTLPHVEAYAPTDAGESPLASIRDWVEVSCPICGGSAERETDTMPNWAGSSWYFLRYCDPHNDTALASPESLNYWMPVDLYNGGMEHTTLHLLYSRFWYKFLWDIDVVPEECGPEPYKVRRSHGLILAEGGEKMSKSKGNVVNPDEVVAQYGADVFRVYELFMGPFDQPVPWDTNGIEGVKRFLDKTWNLFDPSFHGRMADQAPNIADLDILLNQTIHKVTEDIEHLRFNTCISQLMILVKEYHLSGSIPVSHKESLIKLLAPFAPHAAEELWKKIGNASSVHVSGWPEYEARKLTAKTFELVIQVNGKVRDRKQVASEISEEDAKEVALSSEKIQPHIRDKQISKVIYIPGKLVNIVA